MTIRMGWQSASEQAFLYAQQYGLFQKYGLNVEASKFNSGPEELSAIASHSLDIAQLGAPPWISALNQGANLQIFFPLVDNIRDGLWADPNKIKSVPDMVGHKIGVTRGTGPDGSVHEVLKKLGIPFDKVTFVNLQPAQMPIAYQRGDIDGAWTQDTWGPRLLGAKFIGGSAQYGFHQPAFESVDKGFLDKNPEAVARLSAALGAAAEAVNKDPKSVSKQVADLAGLPEDQMLSIMKDEHSVTLSEMLDASNPLSLVSPNGFGSQLQGLAAVMV
ncbi:MAG: NrtA/SsuA/CpmA family ABC transporter substrate-binding protein, partial [Chloroflexota bacterium]|nr:NrtA/SsuA/CpmA family ABC transporter substrate-binding protein [Chloroflexota bacterium]